MRFSVAIALVLSGCATHSGVIPMGRDSFMISRQAATGLSGLGNMKGEIFQEASAYCAGQGKELQVVSTNESAPPYVLGNFPRAEVQFMCLSPGDKDLGRPKLIKQPDAVIEVK